MLRIQAEALTYDDVSLVPAHSNVLPKDVSLATAVGREFGVPMRVANLALEELTEALNRGWAGRDSRVAMLLQEERAGVKIAVPADQVRAVVEKG